MRQYKFFRILIFKMNRFDNCNENTIKNYIEKSKNINTTKATNQWIHLYCLWAESK